jgi:hypothetical protein
MTRKLFPFAVLLLSSSFLALAADAVSGKWTFDLPGRQGVSRQVTLNLKADGEKLSGTVLQPMGMRQGGSPSPLEIKNGKVQGDAVSFEVVQQGGSGPITTKYDGVVSGGEMKLKIVRELPNGPQSQDVVAKKSS